MQLTLAHVISLIITFLMVVIVGIYSGRRLVPLLIFLWVVGKRVYVGSRQLWERLSAGGNYQAQRSWPSTISVWWFTLGAGIGCLLLAFQARPLREGNYETVPEILAGVYGDQVRTAACIFSSIGIFLNLVGQMLAAVALLTSMLGISSWLAAVVAAVLIIVYVVFGGVWGTSLVGLVKLILLYSLLIIVGWQAYELVGGWRQLQIALPAFPWFSLFGRGVTVDLAAGFSLIVGVLSTQTYIQNILFGRDTNASRKGAMLAAILVPLAGIPGILVGLYMRLNFAGLPPVQAFPVFILTHLPSWLAGIALATLIITVVGTGAGLVLGISTMLTKDIYSNFSGNTKTERNLLVLRLVIVGVMLLCLGVVLSGNLSSLILDWSYLSMGLRGATICLPLVVALLWPRRVSPVAGKLAVILAPTAVLGWKIWGGIIDPLYPGLAVSALILAVGMCRFKTDAKSDF